MKLNEKQLQDFQKKFGDILNERDIITDQDTIAPHLVDWVGNISGSSALMLTPRNSEQVSKILRLCNEETIAVVPQGGNTGSVASGIPNGEIILSLEKMSNITVSYTHLTLPTIYSV